MKPTHPDSAIPIIQKLNKLIYSTWKPKWKNGYWAYGRLYYAGDYGALSLVNDRLDPTWMLSGMTPVGAASVLRYLKEAGHDVAEYEKYFSQLKSKHDRANKREIVLRKSAAAKLTLPERKACGLTA